MRERERERRESERERGTERERERERGERARAREREREKWNNLFPPNFNNFCGFLSTLPHLIFTYLYVLSYLFYNHHAKL